MRRVRTSAVRRRIACVVAMVVALSVAIPPNAVPAGGRFPLTWLSWFAQRPAWASAEAFLGLPAQSRAVATAVDHHVPAGATRAGGGAGRAPDSAADTIGAYQPHKVDAPRKGTGPADPGFDSRTSQLMPERSTARTEFYSNADGSITQRTYDRPIHYQKPDGSWDKIDTSLVQQPDGRLQMKAHRLKVSFAGGGRSAPGVTAGPTAELASMTLPTGELVAYSLDGATIGDPVVDGTTAVYRGVLPFTDLELSTFDSGVKETLVFASPDAPSTWVFPLRLRGLTPRLNAEGAVDLVDAAGEVVAVPSRLDDRFAGGSTVRRSGRVVQRDVRGRHEQRGAGVAGERGSGVVARPGSCLSDPRRSDRDDQHDRRRLSRQ